MSFWHKHCYERVATTYAAPVLEALDIETVNGDVSKLDRWVFGATTFVWKCSDGGCDSVIVQVALGKVQP